MSEADALSYLLFGRPAERQQRRHWADENRDAANRRAIAGICSKHCPSCSASAIRSASTSSRCSRRTSDAGELMAGKYLSPKVYIRYSYGLFNRIGGLLLRFEVNDRLSIETRSGEQESMDLFYTVEKD